MMASAQIILFLKMLKFSNFISSKEFFFGEEYFEKF
jgi:hypothetical protein